MPRKVRQLKADLREAGFLEQSQRGKGSHSLWVHPQFPSARALLSGKDGDDAFHYQEKDVQSAIAEARRQMNSK